MTNNPVYNQLIEQIVAERPELSNYVTLFQHLVDNNNGEHSESQKTLALDRRLRKLNLIARQLKEDLDDAIDDLDDLAKALGACAECWGRDNRCPTCKGEGQAGYFKPDKELFDQLILPALSKVPWLGQKEN
jgi:hypothetical protein